MKVLLSTGNGRLHLILSSIFIKKKNVDINVLTGWLPNRVDSVGVKIATFLTGHKNLAAGMQKRQTTGSGIKMISCPLPEFFTQFLFLLSRKTGLMSKDTAATVGWTFFGWYSSFHIKGYDIFHVRAGAGRGSAIIKAKKNGAKVVVDHSIAHPSFFDENVNSEIEKYGDKPFITSSNNFWKMVLKDCDSADLILVNSDFVKETLVRYGYQKSKVEVVYLGVREDFYSLKSEYKRSKTLNILFTGSFEIRKGAEYILKAMQVLDNCGFSYTLTVVGSNSEANDILKKFPIKYLNLVGHVPQDELVDYLSVADIYLFPSLAEGCAVSAMEAMAAGLPVIVTKESGVPVDDHINGLEVPSKDVQRIVDAIFELESDEELRKKIGSNAAKTIANNYSWDLYSEKVKGLYLDLVNSQEH